MGGWLARGTGRGAWGLAALGGLLLAAAPARAVDHLEEHGAPLDVAQVAAAGLEPLAEPRSLGFTGRPVWVRFRAEHEAGEPTDRLLTWDWPLVERLEFHEADGRGGWRSFQGGLEPPVASRRITHAAQRHLRVVRLGPGESLDVYVRVATRGPVLLAGGIHRARDVIAGSAALVYWLGAWSGAIAVLAALALLSWFTTRRAVHLEYALLSAVVGAYQALMSGVLPAGLPWLGRWAVPLEPLLGAGAAFCGVRFAVAYAEPGRYLPRLDRPLRIAGWACAAAAAPALWGQVALANRLNAVTSSLAIGLVLAAVVAAAARGAPAARRFLVGFGPFAVGCVWYVGMLAGLLPPAVAAQVAFQATFLLTGLAVALALAGERREEEARNREHLEAAVADRQRALDATVARLEAAQRLEAVGRLTAGVAHDFNNLLAAISAGVGELQRGPPEPGPADPVVEEVRGLVRRGGELTRSLLLVARRQPLEPRPVALNALVEELVHLLERLVKGIALELDLDPSAGTVLADPGQLEQVVLNLVLNARDACDGRGRIVVATRLVTRAAGEGGRPGGEWARLSVQDDGKGMDEATRARVFEPFFTTKGEGKGTGVGLAVVGGVARAHGGFVEVTSSPGRGSTFVVWLPVAGEARLDAERLLTPPPPGALTGGARSVT